MMTASDDHCDPAGKSEPLRANRPNDEVPEPTDLPVREDGGTAERQRRYVARYDPRRQPQITQRDIQALLFIGRGHEVAQYQLHVAVFGGLSEGIMSRWTQRMLKRGLIAVERWAKVGINRLRLTPKGRDTLVSCSVAVDDVFTPRTPTALKDVQHTLWINDLRVVLPKLCLPPDVIAPAWLLQRRLDTIVPDVLAIRTPRGTDAGYVLAVEVDLGGERLKSVLLPKLARLREQLTQWAGGAPTAVLVLTRGEHRIVALRAGLAADGVPVLVERLPALAGRSGLCALQNLLVSAVRSGSGKR
jgi:DNA-binding MarR family transcriptional regulator